MLSQELNVVYDRAVARRLEEVFAADLTDAMAVDHDRWRRSALQPQFFEFLVLPLRDML